jgi:tripartite-type tricarboxylate transporter receptor subunit TctC
MKSYERTAGRRSLELEQIIFVNTSRLFNVTSDVRHPVARYREQGRNHVMHISRRSAVIGGVASLVFPAWAQSDDNTYPSRPVHIIVPFAAGGATDIYARLIGQWLTERLGQQFVVENRPGAGTNIGITTVVRAPPDGYTLLLAGTPSAIGASVYKNLDFIFLRDIVPIAGIVRIPLVMLAHPSVPATTLAELIAYAKANPGKITVGTPGVGTSPHVCLELFKTMAGVNMVHVPYRGDVPALTDVLAGQVSVFFGSLTASIGQIRAGKLRPLAVTTATRAEMFPDIPTVGEFLSGFEAAAWFGIGAPKNTPVEIVSKLNQEINAGLAAPKLKAQIAELAGVTFPGSPADFGKFIAEETEKWGKVVKAANIKAE